jgi:hypothetical protein
VKTVITMSNDPVEIMVETINDAGIKRKVPTNLQNIQAIFSKEQIIESPLLPTNWGVIKFYQKGNYEGYILTTPPQVREVNVVGSKKRKGKLPLPPLLWFFEVLVTGQSRRLTHTMVFALKHEVLSMEDELFHAPFPNVGVGHGICWGSSGSPQVGSIKSLQNVMPRFFSQAFNGDLAGGRLNRFTNEDGQQSESAYCHITTLIKQYKDDPEKFVYPLQDLRSSGSNIQAMAQHYLPNLVK